MSQILLSQYLYQRANCHKNRQMNPYIDKYGFKQLNIVFDIIGLCNSSKIKKEKNRSYKECFVKIEEAKGTCFEKQNRVEKKVSSLTKTNKCCRKTVSRAIKILAEMGYKITRVKSKAIIKIAKLIESSNIPIHFSSKGVLSNIEIAFLTKKFKKLTSSRSSLFGEKKMKEFEEWESYLLDTNSKMEANQYDQKDWIDGYEDDDSSLLVFEDYVRVPSDN